MKKQVKLNFPYFFDCNFNKYARIESETDKYYFISIQRNDTLERFTRAFSKKTLKCFNNTSKFTKSCFIESFL
jgi:hypothetical protein